MTLPAIDTDQLYTFTDCIFDKQDRVEVRRIGLDQDGDTRAKSAYYESPDEMVGDFSTIIEWNATNDVYFGVSPRETRGATDADVIECRTIFADFDNNTTVDEASQRIADAGFPPPTVLVCSGHGTHAYWRLEDEIDTDTFRQMQQGIARTLGSDPKVQNPSRVMRVPFTHHVIKPGQAECFITDMHSERRYALDAFEFKPVEPDSEPKASRHTFNRDDHPNAFERCSKYVEAMPPAISGQGGHDATFEVACTCFRFGLSEHEARQILDTYNQRCEPPWSDRELEHKISEASRVVSESGDVGSMLGKDTGFNWTKAAEYADRRDRREQKETPADETDESKADSASKSKPLFTFHTAAEFDSLDLKRDYHIPGILAAGPPTVLAGSFKTLKTSIGVDLLLSLAAGRPFLGQYPVNHTRVAFMSGESGGYALQNLARRVATAKAINLADVGDAFRICTTVPKLNDNEHLHAMYEFIADNEIGLFAVDPIYLAMAGLRSDDAGNLFKVGEMLEPLTAIGRATGCTMMAIHHNSRGATRANSGEPAELADIAWGGFPEWAGQWLLLARRERYDPDSDGEHRLWLTAGGRDGHSTLVGVNVTEGRQDSLSGRKWLVDVGQAASTRKAAADAEQQRREQHKREKQYKQLEGDRMAIIGFLKSNADGDTQSRIRDRLGLNSSRFSRAFDTLIEDGFVVGSQITKTNGQTYEGYKLDPDALGRTRTNQ